MASKSAIYQARPTGPKPVLYLGSAVPPHAPTGPGSTAGSLRAPVTINGSCPSADPGPRGTTPAPTSLAIVPGRTAPAPPPTPRQPLPDHRGLWARNMGLATMPRDPLQMRTSLAGGLNLSTKPAPKMQTLTGRHQVVVPASTTAARCETSCPTRCPDSRPRLGPAKDHRFAQPRGQRR